MLPSQSKTPHERTLEKLARLADKRGTDSAAAQAMKDLTHPVEGVTPQKPKKVTEIKETKE
jgi:hypothetical protein